MVINKPYPKVLFLCRGSMQDGMGHVNRSRSVAEAFLEIAALKMVIIGEPYVENLLAGSHFDYCIVSNEKDALVYISNFKPDIVIFDLLEMRKDVFDYLKEQAILTASLSPIFNFINDLDILFHRTKYLNESWSTEIEKCYGLPYTVINKHVRKIPESLYRHTLQQDNLSIAISMGGTDAPNKTLRVLDVIKQYPQKLLIWTILGEGYSHSYFELVDSIKNSQHEIILAKTNDAMWRILSYCALIILAGGITTYEAAYAGLPSVNLLNSTKHYFLIQELVEKNVCLSIGNDFVDSLNNLNDTLIKLDNDRVNLLDMHIKTKELIDNQGAWRIMNKVMNLYYIKSKHYLE